MKKALTRYYALMIAALMTASCSDFLGEESQDEVRVKTVSDYSELLLGAAYPSPTGSLYNIMYILDDDEMLNDVMMEADEDYQSAIGAFSLLSWQPNMWQDINLSQTYYSDPYTATYNRIVAVNAVLDGIDEATGNDDEERDMVRAEAHALRAYYYYMLTNLFGEPYCVNPDAPGVPLKLTAGIETNGRGRNTVRECYEQILDDLNTAAGIFEHYPKRRGAYRINLPSVCILLTRVYLQMEQWDMVAEAATHAIESGGNLTNYNNEGSSYKTISSYDYSEVEWLYGNGYRPCSLPGFKASDDLFATFAPDDKRAVLWFTPSHAIYKHRLAPQRTPTMAMRTSEAWIARAEALARTGHESEALDDLNHLRYYRYASGTQLSLAGDELLDEILRERRRELCYQEVRWFDLRRLGMPSIQHRYKTRSTAPWVTYTLAQGDPLYTLPIPEAVINENTELEQNASARQPIRRGE